MNAFTPKATVLIKLAELLSLLTNPKVPQTAFYEQVGTLLDDREVIAWMDRMAELEYIPHRMDSPNHLGGKIGLHGKIVALPLD